jgi:hypothetical protein
MKRVLSILMACTTLIVLIFTVAFSNVYANDDIMVVDLIAGQHINAGSITVWDDDENLYIQYETVDPYCLTETHLEIASSLEGIPQKNGNPIPGRFEHKSTHSCVSTFTYTAPLPENACDLYFAAHAVVKGPSGTETAWGNGPEFPGKNWATYFIYEVSDCSCQTTAVKADFSKVDLGESVEGMGVVAPDLNINGKETAVKIEENSAPRVYGAPSKTPQNTNGGLAEGGGFSDKITQEAQKAHKYIFTFAPGTPVKGLSLHMLDFGDLNPTSSTRHRVVMKAFDANNTMVDVQKLKYTSDGKITNAYSPLYGNLITSGDAVSADPGQPGNWTWLVDGNDIVKVVLRFGKGYDPNIGFDTLEYTTVTCQ